MPTFMVTVRGVTGSSFNGLLGPIRYLSIPDGVDQPSSDHVVSRTEWLKQVTGTFAQDAQGNATGNLLFFVHGFNEAIKDVAEMHGRLAKGLNGRLPCTIVSFDWPSEGKTYAYLPDLDTASRTAIDLVNAAIVPLIKAQKDTCRVATHAICHSMGAYVVREALDHADKGTFTGSDWSLNQLVLVAGDVEASDFVPNNRETESMLEHCYRLTNYFNKADEVLQISNVKRLGVEPRVGRVGLPLDAPTSTVNVDCSDHYAAVRPAGLGLEAAASYSHSWYFQDANFYADLAETLKGALDRTVIPGRQRASDGRTLLLEI